jgi:ABC-type amino acid transport substrate-binding protein
MLIRAISNSPVFRGCLRGSTLLAGLLVAAAFAQAEDENADALDRVRERGALTVAVYEDFPPFSFRGEKGRVVGIDADLARALAERLSVAAVVRAVGADESMEDDLRNNVWKGHYLGGGVADVMLHVPFDEEFAEENDRVIFVAPYFREEIVVAVAAGRGSHRDALDLFTREKVGVELDTLADFYLLRAADGRIRDQVVHYRNMGEAVAALKRGELAGVMGPRSEIEFALGGQRAEFSVGPVPMPGLRSTGWDLGAAVKQGNESLAEAVESAMKALREEGVLEAIFTRYHASYRQPARLTRLAVDAPETVAASDTDEVCRRRP